MKYFHAVWLLFFFVLSCDSNLKDQATKEYLAQYQDQKSPLAIDYHSPEGVVPVSQNKIVIHFTQPMVSLSALKPNSNSSLVTIEPKPEGYFKWVNTKTLVYQVKEKLEYATTYHVKVKSGHESLLGLALIKDFNFSFATPKPQVTKFYPAPSSKNVALDQVIRIDFNQDVDINKVGRFINYSLVGGTAIDYTLECFRAKKDDPIKKVCSRVTVKPKKPLSKFTSSSLIVDKGLQGVAGTDASDISYSAVYTTYGDFNISKIECEKKCRPNGALKIQSSTPIKPDEFYKYVSFQPEVKGLSKSYGYWSNSSSTFNYYVSLDPYTEYVVTLKPGLEDRFGQKLKEKVQYSFKTEHLRARFFFPYITDQVMNVSDKLNFGFLATNIKSATAQFRLNLSDAELIELSEDSKKVLDFFDNEKKWDVTRFFDGQIDDEKKFFSIDVTGVLEDDTHAIVVSQYKSPQVQSYNYKTKEHYPTRNWFLKQVTDLAIDAKLSKEDGLVWLTSLNTGKAKPNTVITVYNSGAKELYRGVTNHKGLLEIPGWEKLMRLSLNKEKDNKKKRHDPFYIFAKSADDRAFITSQWTEGLGTYGFYGYNESSEEGTERKVRAHLLTDRGLYKPGETVKIKGYLRQVTAKGLEPFTESFTVEIDRPRSKTPEKYSVTPNARGNFDLSYTIPEHGALGSYSIDLVTMDKWLNFAPSSKYFSVQKFRTPEFKVQLKGKAKMYYRNDPLTVDVSSEYLFGAPVKKGKTFISVSSYASSFSPKNDKDFSFGRLWEHTSEDEEKFEHLYREESVVLNDKGVFEFTQKTEGKRVDPIRYSVEASVTDLSGQQQSSRRGFMVHPAQYYIGARLDQLFYETDQQIKLMFATINAEGKYLFEHKVKANLMRVKWISVKRETLKGQFETEIQKVTEKVDSCEKKASSKENECEFKISEAGYYYISLQGKDAKDRMAVTEVPLYVSGKSYSYWPSEDSHSLELVKDKMLYRKGDVAEILIKSPYQSAQALISVERDHVLSYYTKKLEGSTSIVKLPIKEAYAPNIFVSVVLVKGATDIDQSHGQVKAHQSQALVRAGRIEVPVEPYEKDIQLSIEPEQKVYKPGEMARVKFKIDDFPKSKDAEITVMVVDEGVLLAGGYRLKNPLDTFYASYYHDVNQLDARIYYVGMQGMTEKGEDPASGGGKMNQFRKKFIPLAYFNGELLSKNGEAVIEFEVPDQLTTFKVLAIANAGVDKFGLGEAEFKTQRDLMIRPALPRFIRVGDKIKSTVVLHNNTDQKMVATLNMESDNLKLLDKASDQVTIPAKGTATYVTKFEAEKDALTQKIIKKMKAEKSLNSSLQGQVRFIAQSGDSRDSVEISFPIYLEQREETVSSSGISAGTVSEFLEKTSDMREDFGDLEISLSGNLTAKLKNKIHSLQVYPYECLEQRMSKVYPLMIFPRRDELFTGDYKDSSLRYETVNDFVKYLKSHQSYSGEFKLWPSSATDPSLTILVGEFVAQAQESGHKVDSLVGKLHNRLKIYLKGKSHYSLKKYSDSYLQKLKANALYVLYLLGYPETSYYHDVRTQFSQYDFQTQARVVEMLFALDPTDPVVSQWLKNLKNNLRVKGDEAYAEVKSSGFYYGTNHRVATARVLQTLMKVKPFHPFIFQMLSYLVNQKSKSQYASSVETVEVLKALWVYQKVFPGSTDPVHAKLAMNGKELIQSKLTLKDPVDQLKLPLNKLPQSMDLKVINESQGPLFYDLNYSYVMKNYRSYGLEEGISYNREYYDVDGSRVEAEKLRHGRTYRVVLNFFFADEANDVVIEENLPAGLEPLNFALKTSRRQLNFKKQNGNSGRLSSYLNHREFHDRKILLFSRRVPRGFFEFDYYVNVTNQGEFLVPPSKAMEMYKPEIFGTTAAENVIVK